MENSERTAIDQPLKHATSLLRHCSGRNCEYRLSILTLTKMVCSEGVIDRYATRETSYFSYTPSTPFCQLHTLNDNDRSIMRSLLRAILLLLAASSRYYYRGEASAQEAPRQRPRPHHNNHAIIVSTSRYWFNYRHHTNALLIYQYLKSSYGNYTDDRIILMLADEYNVNPRNPIKNQVYNTATDSVHHHRRSAQQQQHHSPVSSSSSSLYTDDIEIDYRGEDVNVENFVRALTGRSGDHHHPVLHTDADSHILMYLTGHGGDSFLKFQDNDEITSVQLAEIFQYMHQRDQYREILFLADTCQAFTLGDDVISRRVPNIYVVGTSLRGESSYAHSGHPIIGVSVVEKYTHYMMEYVTTTAQQQSVPRPSLSLSQVLVEPFNTSKQTNMLHAHVGFDDSTLSRQRKLHQVPWDDFFVQQPTRDGVDDTSIPRLRPLPNPPWPWRNAEFVTTRVSPNDAKITTLAVVTTTTSQQCDHSEHDFDSETMPLLEPDHPVFMLLLIVLISLVVVGSTFY